MKLKHVAMMGEAEIRSALGVLAVELQKLNIHATIHVLGSVALMFSYPGLSRVTVDIDVVCDTPSVVGIARNIASSLNLPTDWFNEDASVFMRPTLKFTTNGVPQFKNLLVRVLEPESLFAMKCFAGRKKDLADLSILTKNLGLVSFLQVEDVYQKYYEGDAFNVVVMEFFLDYFGELA